jgi:hypothetical protein
VQRPNFSVGRWCALHEDLPERLDGVNFVLRPPDALLAQHRAGALPQKSDEVEPGNNRQLPGRQQLPEIPNRKDF